jgi:hypothetical protein
MRSLRTLGALLLASLAAVVAAPAEAGIIYSFSNLPMTTGTIGDPTMYLSGSFGIPQHSYSPLSNLTSAWHTPVSSIDLTVTDGAGFSRSFTDPNYFMYQDGLAVNGRYLVDLSPNAFMPLLDAYWDQISITIDSNTVVTDGEFSSITFPRGFSTYSFANGVNSDSTVPATETSTVSEPPTLSLMLMGLLAIGLRRWFKDGRVKYASAMFVHGPHMMRVGQVGHQKS